MPSALKKQWLDAFDVIQAISDVEGRDPCQSQQDRFASSLRSLQLASDLSERKDYRALINFLSQFDIRKVRIMEIGPGFSGQIFSRVLTPETWEITFVDNVSNCFGRPRQHQEPLMLNLSRLLMMRNTTFIYSTFEELEGIEKLGQYEFICMVCMHPRPSFEESETWLHRVVAWLVNNGIFISIADDFSLMRSIRHSCVPPGFAKQISHVHVGGDIGDIVIMQKEG
jgi:hypothetical protein